MEAKPQVSSNIDQDSLNVIIGGQWSIEKAWPDAASTVMEELYQKNIYNLNISSRDLGKWDSSLLVFLVQLIKRAKERHIKFYMDLPQGLQSLVNMAFTVPPRKGALREQANNGFLYDIGVWSLGLAPRMGGFLHFLGAVTVGFGRLISGHSKMRAHDLFNAMFECGVLSLPIISLTTLLFGLILAFVGAVQLTQFGAQIYVAGLVGIGMLRVMGAVMVGVVMSGRIGAAYAAYIGTMQVNEEIDALETIGISPIDFLVVPRTLALTIMTPILTIYADLMGILGGYLVGTIMLGLNPMEYLNATVHMVHFKQAVIGLVYSLIFGIVIALAGCYQGMNCGRSAMAVGEATTRAVVASIVGIIVMTAIITIICNVLRV